MTLSLIDSLRGRKEPLLIDIDEYGCIVAAEYEFSSMYSVGVVFCHPEGDIDIGVDAPTRAEVLHVENPEFTALPDSAKKATIMEKLGYCPWIDDSDEPDERCDSEDCLARWLAENLEGDEFISWVPRELSEHLPGFDLLSTLDQATQKRLGLREVDIGGPASGGCWAVRTEASGEKLNAALVAADLPFRVIGV